MKRALLIISAAIFIINFFSLAEAEQSALDAGLEFVLDANSKTIQLPKVFSPNINLSGRGFSHQASLPKGMPSLEVLERWENEMGFSGIYRLNYNLWEEAELSGYKETKEKFIANYDFLLQKITDSDGVAIISLFGTPSGMGRAFDCRSVPKDMKAYKSVVKEKMRYLSCQKHFNIWYEAWNTPDLEEFFLGRAQDYFNIYRAIAEASKELEQEYKIHIPVGGPGVSWWFQGLDENNITNAEKSFIYELLKFVSRNKLALDFVSWHAYTNDPFIEQEKTIYNESSISLLRQWLEYFHFNYPVALIIDEWNYDDGVNVTPARGEKSYLAASYYLSRLFSMYKEGLDQQVYFSIEDFYNSKESIVRNCGVFWFNPQSDSYEGGAKSSYTVMRMLNYLGKNIYESSFKKDDPFVGMIASKADDRTRVLLFNYIDKQAGEHLLYRSVATLPEKERRILLKLIKENRLGDYLSGKQNIAQLRVGSRFKNILKQAQDLTTKKSKFTESSRFIKITFKNLTGSYILRRYVVEESCGPECIFEAKEEKEITAQGAVEQELTLDPYQVVLLELSPKPQPPPEIVLPVEELTKEPEPAVEESK